jgi:transcriptional regulator with XRE-family HTH domain
MTDITGRLRGLPLGQQLRTVRKEYGWTLRHVAKAAGISVSFLSDLEHGRSSPSIDTLQRLTDVYGPVFDYPLGRPLQHGNELGLNRADVREAFEYLLACRYSDKAEAAINLIAGAMVELEGTAGLLPSWYLELSKEGA